MDEPATPKARARLAVLKQFAADAYHLERWERHVPLRVNPEAAQETQQSIDWDYDRTALLQNHAYPVTVINGEHDYVVDVRDSPIWRKLAREHMPSVRVVVIRDAGHAAWLDQPEAFAIAAGAALRR